MAGNKRPARPYTHKLEARIIVLEARMVAVMDGVEKLAVMVQRLSTAYGRIIQAAQASAAAEAPPSEAGIVIASAQELPK